MDWGSDRQADTQRDKQKGHRKRQTDKRLRGRQTVNREIHGIKKVIIVFATYFIYFISLTFYVLLAVPQALYYKFLYYNSITYVTSISLAM